MYMKKILLTEAQSKLVEAYKKEKALLESVERTVGGLSVRNLIKEGEEITGEYRNVYGQWHPKTWKADGTPQEFSNKFDVVVNTLPLK